MRWNRHRLAGTALGLGLAASGLPLYVSHANRPILGRWSPEYVVVMAAAVGVYAIILFAILRRKSETALPDWLRLADAGVLLCGAGYAASALEDNRWAASFIDLNVLGSPNLAGFLLAGAGAVLVTLGSARWAWLTTPPRFQNPVLAIAAVATMLASAELLARVRVAIWPTTQGFPTYSGDVWRQRYVTTNSRGYRDAEHTVARAAGFRRIAVIGDSYAFGEGVEDPSARFGEQMGTRLERPGIRWEAINASRGDTHTLTHIEFLRDVLEYRPDLAILLYVFNDIDHLHPVTPRGPLSEAPQGLLTRLNPVRVLFKNSFLFQELYVRWWHAVGPSATRESLGAYADSALIQRHLDDLESFVRVGRQAGASVVIVPLDIGLLTEAGTKRYHRFVDALRERRLPACPLSQAFDGETFAALRVNRLDGHPNGKAYGLAADAVTECVRSHLSE